MLLLLLFVGCGDDDLNDVEPLAARGGGFGDGGDDGDYPGVASSSSPHC